MKVLIIGSKGFIGQHALQFFTQKGLETWGCDVVVDYTAERYFLIDASNSDFKQLFKKEKFDWCLNCSGAASVPASIENPLRDYFLNTVNVFKLLDAIRLRSPACKFINLSSAAVYGNPKALPITETHEINPISPYGFHKLQAEQICQSFAYNFNVKCCSLRIYSAYGEGLKKQLFFDLYKKTKQNKPIKLFGSGRESRDFIYIKDLLYVIELVFLHHQFHGDAINVANGEEIYIDRAVESFYSFFDQPIDYVFSGKARKGDPNNWIADISKLQKLGYKRKYSFEQGLENYYNWVVTLEGKEYRS